MSYLDPTAAELERAQRVVDAVRAGAEDWFAVLRHFNGDEFEANDAINHAEAQGWVTLLRNPGTGEASTFLLHDSPSRVSVGEAAERVLSRLDYGTRKKNKQKLAGETRLPGGVVRQALDYLKERGQAERVGRGGNAAWVKPPPGGSAVTVTRKPPVPAQAVTAPARETEAVAEPPATQDVPKAPEAAQSGEPTRTQDPALRTAMERRSLDVARDYYLNELGGTNYEEVGKPYDIRVTVNGVERHCEVKGSSARIDTVELTTNEVDHGTTFEPTDLIVVDGIEPVRDPTTGEVTHGAGGRRRVWSDWKPERDNLKPLTFTYRLPR